MSMAMPEIGPADVPNVTNVPPVPPPDVLIPEDDDEPELELPFENEPDTGAGEEDEPEEDQPAEEAPRVEEIQRRKDPFSDDPMPRPEKERKPDVDEPRPEPEKEHKHPRAPVLH